MKTNSVQQEILLLTNTSLTQNSLFEKNALENNENTTYAEQLEVACWNGMLDEMLPGIVAKSVTGESLYLWEILQGMSFLDIELCEYPQIKDMAFSINPYAFLATVCYQ